MSQSIRLKLGFHVPFFMQVLICTHTHTKTPSGDAVKSKKRLQILQKRFYSWRRWRSCCFDKWLVCISAVKTASANQQQINDDVQKSCDLRWRTQSCSIRSTKLYNCPSCALSLLSIKFALIFLLFLFSLWLLSGALMSSFWAVFFCGGTWLEKWCHLLFIFMNQLH